MRAALVATPGHKGAPRVRCVPHLCTQVFLVPNSLARFRATVALHEGEAGMCFHARRGTRAATGIGTTKLGWLPQSPLQMPTHKHDRLVRGMGGRRVPVHRHAACSIFAARRRPGCAAAHRPQLSLPPIKMAQALSML